MPNLWDNLFKNAGTWEGSFTRLEADGTETSNTPSRLTLEKVGESRAKFQVERYPKGKEVEKTSTEFSSINRSSMFCEDGSFTKGSMQWSSFSEFGTEFGLTLPNARLRLVQLYKPGGELNYFVLIRETREGQTKVIRPSLSTEQLMGTWKGQAITYFTDWFVADPVPTEWTLLPSSASAQFEQTWRIGDSKGQAKGQQQSSRIFFNEGELEYQLLLLPNGGSSLCPRMIQPRTAFRCELGWLINPTTRLRLIRAYKEDGSWAYQTLITEEKVLH